MSNLHTITRFYYLVSNSHLHKLIKPSIKCNLDQFLINKLCNTQVIGLNFIIQNDQRNKNKILPFHAKSIGELKKNQEQEDNTYLDITKVIFILV
jgi:hypothetical protein